MGLILEDKNKRTINEKEEIVFSSFSSWHLVSITARAKGEKQLKSGSTDDEDLTIEIDGKVFPKPGTKNALIDSPASFNGGKLHNLAETIYFLIFLKGKNHKIIFKADGPSKTATLENLEVYSVNLNWRLNLDLNLRAEDGDRRPWITLVLDGLELKSFYASLNLSRRFIDSDDVKVIVDGVIKRNHRSLLHKFWYFSVSLFSNGEQEELFLTELPKDSHYIEFFADRAPLFREINLDFGGEPLSPQDVPTMDNPESTGNFYDDTETMILARAIFGEAEGVSKDAKMAVGWSVKNRVLAGRAQEWGLGYHGVILKDGSYDSFKKEERLKKLIDPLNTDDKKVKEAWYDSYRIAKVIVKGEIQDPTNGATNFYSTPIEHIPSWATSDRETKTIGNLHFYKL